MLNLKQIISALTAQSIIIHDFFVQIRFGEICIFDHKSKYLSINNTHLCKLAEIIDCTCLILNFFVLKICSSMQCVNSLVVQNFWTSHIPLSPSVEYTIHRTKIWF